MTSVVLYAIGSPLLADVEESLRRAGIQVAAGVHNIAGKSWLSEGTPVVTPEALPGALRQLPYLVGLFTPGHRQKAAREAEKLGFGQPLSLFDPTLAVPHSLEAAAGLYVNVGCTLGAGCRLEEFVLVNRGASIGHHARFGRFVSIGPGAVIAGMVTAGKGALVGAGAVVLPEITIGENAVVGAGAVVTRDVPAHSVVVGNPARVVKTGIAGYHDISVD